MGKTARFVGIFLGVGILIAYGQEVSQVEGFVYDDSTGKPLEGVEIFINELNRWTVTDVNGYFAFRGIDRGTFEFVFSHVGYGEKRVFVTVFSDRSAFLTVRLKPVFIELLPVVKMEVGSSLTEDISGRIIVIENDGKAESLVKLLERESRVVVRKDAAGNDVIQMAGGPPEHVVILIDGQPISDTKKGYTSLNVIPVELVDRVEIVSGGASALSGDGAIGGVVNIVTKSKVNKLLTTTLFFGSFGSGRQAFTLSPSWRRGNIILGVSNEYARNDFWYRNQYGEMVRRKNSQRSALNLFSKVRWIRGDVMFSSLVTFSRSVCGVPGNIYSPDESAKNRVESFIFNNALFWRRIVLRVSCSSFINRYSSPKGIYQVDTRYRVGNYIMSGESELKVEKVKLKVGSGVKFERMISEDLLRPAFSMGEHARSNYYVSVLSDFEFSSGRLKFRMFFPLRYDYCEDFGNMLSYRVGIDISRLWSVYMLKFGGELGTGFKLPTFNQMFWIQDIYSMGNPELKPEESKGSCFMLSFSRRGKVRLDIGVGYSQNRVDDLIVWRRGYANKYIPVNAEKASIRGFDFNIELGLFRCVNVRVGLSENKCLNLTKEPNIYRKYIPYRPLERKFFSLEIKRRGYWVSILNNYYGRVYVTESNTIFLRPFWLTDVVIGSSRQVSEKIELEGMFKVSNLFDTEYYFLEFYPMPGRTFSIAIGLSFRDE